MCRVLSCTERGMLRRTPVPPASLQFLKSRLIVFIFLYALVHDFLLHACIHSSFLIEVTGLFTETILESFSNCVELLSDALGILHSILRPGNTGDYITLWTQQLGHLAHIGVAPRIHNQSNIKCPLHGAHCLPISDFSENWLEV